MEANHLHRKRVAVLIVLCICLGIYYFFTKDPSVTNFPSKGISIVAFGDSLVAGVGASREGDFVSLLSKRINQPIINLGKSGDTTKTALTRLSDVVETQPKVVMILLGGNDFIQKVPQDETFVRLGNIIDVIHKSGAVVVLLGVRGGLLGGGVADRYEDLAKEKKVFYVPDVLSGLFGRTEYMYDAIHPNDKGYQMIADKVEPVLREALGM